MKIGVVSAQAFACPPPGYSGLEMIAYQCAKGLAERGNKVVLFAPEGSQCPGCEIVPTGPPGQWDEKRAYSTYWKRLADLDAVIDHSWQKWAAVGRQEGWLKAPVLAVCHAPVGPDEWNPRGGMFEQLPPKGALSFVCISQDQATVFEARHGRQARVCHNGIDMDFYKPMGLKRSNRFLFLARFSTIKGPDLAIQACQLAGVGLDLVGDTSITNEPEYFAECKAMCDARPPYNAMPPPGWDGIRMVGPAARGECVYWFSQAHCLLHPNMRFREPFGLAPVEAMACGCPVICWDYGAMRETVKHQATGWLVKSLDELVAAVKDFSDERVFWVGKDRRDVCREWASQFSVQNMCARYEELCLEAVNQGAW